MILLENINTKKIAFHVSILLACVFFGTNIFASDDILWESGANLFIKLVKQESKTQPNDHPIELESKEITNAISTIKIWKRANEGGDSVFSIQQARLLGNYLARGFKNAKPNQDIIFTLSRLKPGALGVKEPVFAAGRAFYSKDKLNIIIGDYDIHRDKGAELTHSSANQEYVYNLSPGKRTKKSGFKKNLITGNGIEVKSMGNKRRQDWIIIDVAIASSASLAEKERNKKTDPAEVNAKAIRIEAAKMAKQRRELRAEMARMRKEMASRNQSQNLTPEERLAKLDELRSKNLITDTEYNQKRKEILNDI